MRIVEVNLEDTSDEVTLDKTFFPTFAASVANQSHPFRRVPASAAAFG